MSVQFQSTPTTNNVNLRVSFYNAGREVATLGHGKSEVYTLSFERLRLGSMDPPDYYEQESPGAVAITPGNLAVVDRSVNNKLALRYGPAGGKQQNVVFRKIGR